MHSSAVSLCPTSMYHTEHSSQLKLHLQVE